MKPAAPAGASTKAERRARRALDRLAFGPRPGDPGKIAAQGVEDWIELQLHPERIPDDAVEKRLAAYPSLTMNAGQLIEAYPKIYRHKLFGVFGRDTGPYLDALEMPSAKVLRAALGERQLQEVLTDFWFNHFNVSRDKHLVYYFAVPYEREVIRPRVFGRFRDLLGAVARSPAMLTYFDHFPMLNPAGSEIREGSFREIFARELIQTHTLGTDGAHAQADVTSLARILTGWTVKAIRTEGQPEGEFDWGFHFAYSAHDRGPKTFLGREFEGSDDREGDEALDALAAHPSTSRWIAGKLCRRMIADDPPKTLVELVARRFRETDGDLRETYRALFLAPEFWSERFEGVKFKTPFEFEVSALRAAASDVPAPERSVQRIESMGMPLYRCNDPQGWPDAAVAWINPGALGARRKAAQEISAGLPAGPASAFLASMDFQRR